MSMLIDAYRFGPTVTQATWSATNKASDVILTNSNLDAESNAPAGGGIVLSNSGKNTGKYYVEAEIVQRYSNDAMGFGLYRGTSNLTAFLGGNADGWGMWDDDGTVVNFLRRAYNNNAVLTGSGSITAGTTLTRRIMLAVDFTNQKIWLADDFANGSTRVYYNGGDPATNTGGISFTVGASTYYFAGCPRRGDGSMSSNRNKLRLIDPSAWRYAAPSGFGVWT